MCQKVVCKVCLRKLKISEDFLREDIHLPEPVDLVVHEILGEIASREGELNQVELAYRSQ